MKKCSFLKNQTGLSILEVMIAAGLLGVVSLGVMQATKTMTKSSKRFSQKLESEQLAMQIQSVLRDEYSCEANFNGLSPSGAGTEITEIKRKKPDGTEAVVFESGKSYGSNTDPIFLKKMELKNYNAGTGIADFVITMNKGRKDFDLMTESEKKTVLGTSFGTAILVKTLKPHLILDASGMVKDCVSDKDDYTSGACGMLNGDWTDKVKCKSINVSDNGLDPAITSNGHMAVKKGLTVGSTLSADPGDGSVEVSDKATIKNDTTITDGKLIFNTNDSSINPASSNNLYIQNRAGTTGSNLIVGTSTGARTSITTTSVAINKNGNIGAGLALEVIGNTTLTGSGSTTVDLRVGNSTIQYNGTDLLINRPAGGVVRYRDTLSDEEIASRGFVNQQLGKALTGDPATLSTLLSNLSSLISGNPVQSIAATTCGFYTNMTWNGTRCVDNRTANCPATHRMLGFNNGAINCQPVARTGDLCPWGQSLRGYNADGSKYCSSWDTEIGSFVDGKIAALEKKMNASRVCASKGNNPSVSSDYRSCSWTQSCSYYRSVYVGCHACPQTGAPSCSEAPGGYHQSDSAGCGAFCTVHCIYNNFPGTQSCYCWFNSDATTCTGGQCYSCQ